MTHPLESKQGKVVIVEPAATIRGLLGDVLRSQGFSNITSLATPKDALKTLEIEAVDWVICPIMADADVSGIHLLKLCSLHPQLKSTRFTFLVSPEEEDLLLPSFELGLMSFIRKPFNKDELVKQLKSTFQKLSDVQWNDVLLSADSIRTELAKTTRFDCWLSFEKKLLTLYPGNSEILLGMVEPMFKSGQSAPARKILTQILLIDRKMEPKVRELEKKFFSETEPGEGQVQANTNITGMNSFWILEPDKVELDKTTAYLTKLGIENIKPFDNGMAMAEALKSEAKPDFILMEWQAPGLASPLVLQRIREAGWLDVPIVVLSKDIQEEDIPLLREMSIANLIKKPMNEENFIQTLLWTIQEERRPCEDLTIDRKIKAHQEIEWLKLSFVYNPRDE